VNVWGASEDSSSDWKARLSESLFMPSDINCAETLVAGSRSEFMVRLNCLSKLYDFSPHLRLGPDDRGRL